MTSYEPTRPWCGSLLHLRWRIARVDGLCLMTVDMTGFSSRDERKGGER
jgi:hypothetical protein